MKNYILFLALMITAISSCKKSDAVPEANTWQFGNTQYKADASGLYLVDTTGGNWAYRAGDNNNGELDIVFHGAPQPGKYLIENATFTPPDGQAMVGAAVLLPATFLSVYYIPSTASVYATVTKNSAGKITVTVPGSPAIDEVDSSKASTLSVNISEP